MQNLEELANHIKEEVDDDLNEMYNKTNNEVDFVCKVEGKRKQTVPDLNIDLQSPVIKRSKTKGNDSPVTEATEIKPHNSELIIFTTRLDEMCIFNKDLSRLNRLHIWKEILRESKPMLSQYKHNVTTQTIHKYNNLHKLYDDIKIINDKNLCPIKVEIDEMTVDSTNEDFIQINVNNNDKEIEEGKLSLNDYTRSVNETRLIDNIEEILNIPNNQTSTSEVLERTLSVKPNIIFNSERETLSPKIINVDEFVKPTNGLIERRKSDIQDSTALLRSLCSSIVYTTRLDNMCIMRNTIKYLDGKYVLEEILRESKPNVIYKQNKSPSSINKKNFKRLKAELKILNNKNKIKSLDNRSPKYVNIKLIPSDVYIQITNQSPYAKILVDPKRSNEIDDLSSTAICDVYIYNPKIRSIEKVEANRNISFLIHNKFRDMTEVFVTDDNGNVTELRRFKSRNSVELNKFINNIDSNKRKLKMTACCWFHRNTNIDKVWSNTIARFFKSMHTCRPGSCECCCKPHLDRQSFDTSPNISTCTEVDNASIFKLEKNSLIDRSLDFRKPIKVIKTNKHDTKIRPLMIEINKTERIEHYAVDSRGHINWQITLRPYNNKQLDNTIEQLKNRSKYIPQLKETINTTKEHDIFISKLRARNVPFNVINYLKCTILPNSNDNIASTTPKLKLIKVIHNIEHTRTYTLPSLIKISQILKSKSMLKKRPIFDRVNKIGTRVPGNKKNLAKSNSALNSPANEIISGIVFKMDPDHHQGKTNDSFSPHRLRPQQWLESMQIHNPTTSKIIKEEVDIQDGDETNDNIFNNKTFESFIKIENNNTDIAISNVFSLNDNDAKDELLLRQE